MDEVEIIKRTRAKTPCFWVGQLDCQTQPCDKHDSVALAYEYQALLPERSFSSSPVCFERCPLRKTIRKVKGQESLRDIVERDQHRISTTYYSDCETLDGTDTLPSPINVPTSTYCLPEEESWAAPFNYESKSSCSRSWASSSSLEDKEDNSTSAGFQVCLELLTDQLAEGLFGKHHHHAAEYLDRVPGLQILLMIEAYESVLQHIRGEMSDPYLAGFRLVQLVDTEQLLEHWLLALYSVYEET